MEDTVTNTDIHWENWGKKEPYFGVITNKKYRLKNITAQSKLEFFKSGRNHVNNVMKIYARYFAKRQPERILDFGCGVGRFIVHFAKVTKKIVGVDVSGSMLAEAIKNCQKHSVTNAILLKTNDNLSPLQGKFDLIHSFIVFQHINAERGRDIFVKLLSYLKPRGFVLCN